MNPFLVFAIIIAGIALLLKKPEPVEGSILGVTSPILGTDYGVNDNSVRTAPVVTTPIGIVNVMPATQIIQPVNPTAAAALLETLAARPLNTVLSNSPSIIQEVTPERIAETAKVIQQLITETAPVATTVTYSDPPAPNQPAVNQEAVNTAARQTVLANAAVSQAEQSQTIANASPSVTNIAQATQDAKDAAYAIKKANIAIDRLST